MKLFSRILRRVFFGMLFLLLSACGGGGGSSSNVVNINERVPFDSGPEILRLLGTVRFEFKLDETPSEPYKEEFHFSRSSERTFENGDKYLIGSDEELLYFCFVVASSGEFFCELLWNNGAWGMFSFFLGPNLTGKGDFQECDPSGGVDACIENLFFAPKGRVDVFVTNNTALSKTIVID